MRDKRSRRRGEAMRKFHRWIMTVFVLLTTYWSVSGLTLAIYDLTDKNQTWAFDGGGHGPDNSDATTPRLPAPQLATLLVESVKIARATDPGAPVMAAELRMNGGVVEGLVDLGGAAPRELVIDTTTGRPVADTAPPTTYATLHSRIKDWHRGNIIGNTGVWLALATGVALLTLIVSGVIVYGTMLAARFRIGRRALFWR